MLATESGKLATVQDVTYKGIDDDETKTVTADKRKKAAVTSLRPAVSPAIAAAQHESPEQTFNRELSNVASRASSTRSGRPPWRRRPKAASLNELTDPRKRDAVLAGGEPLRQHPREEPLYLQGLVDKKTQNFFEAMRVAKTLPGKTMEEAADMARRAAIEPQDDETLKGHFREIDQKVLSADPRGPGKWLANFLGEAARQHRLRRRPHQRPREALRPPRPPPTEAIKQAAEAVSNTSTVVNGWVVPNLGKVMPADFKPTLSAYMADFAKKFGKLNDGIGPNDIGVSYDGAGTFTLVKRTARPSASPAASPTSPSRTSRTSRRPRRTPGARTTHPASPSEGRPGRAPGSENTPGLIAPPSFNDRMNTTREKAKTGPRSGAARTS
jgi:hypothetical protein